MKATDKKQKEFEVTAGGLPVITPEMFKELQKELRDLDFSWGEKICERMKNDESLELLYRDCTYAKIYAVFNGQIKNKLWKAIVYSQGKLLKERLLQQIKQVV